MQNKYPKPFSAFLSRSVPCHVPTRIPGCGWNAARGKKPVAMLSLPLLLFLFWFLRSVLPFTRFTPSTKNEIDFASRTKNSPLRFLRSRRMGRSRKRTNGPVVNLVLGASKPCQTLGLFLSSCCLDPYWGLWNANDARAAFALRESDGGLEPDHRDTGQGVFVFSLFPSFVSCFIHSFRSSRSGRRAGETVRRLNLGIVAWGVSKEACEGLELEA